MAPVGGVDYSRFYAEFRSWFPDDEACLDGTKRRSSTAPPGARRNPSSLALPPAERPWRRLNLN